MSKNPFYSLVPKDLKANLEFRRRLLEEAKDKKTQQELWIMCRRDLLFYINAMCWILEPRTSRVLPFITYTDFQDSSLTEIDNAISDHDLPIVKSRDMGASWMVCTVMEWRWHFQDYQSFLLLSRKEELVDAKDDPKSLFTKIDFLHKHQPKWLLPNMDRMAMHLANLDNNSVIDGESTNEFAGVGDRRTAMLLDEYSKMPNQDIIFSGTRDSTKCRIFVFTPEGTNNTSYKVATGGKFKTMWLHWSQHPDKRLGMYKVNDDLSIEIIDKKWHLAHSDYKFRAEKTKYKNLRSPWYDEQCDRAIHDREIAKELDLSFEGSDAAFFESDLLERVRESYCRVPCSIGDFDIVPDSADPVEFVPRENGPLSMWIPSPMKGRQYVMGVDISAGTGASNSVLAIGDANTREKVAEYVNRHLKPYELAKVAVALCKWFNGAYLIYEANGPGREFGDSVMDTFGYRNVFYRQNERSVSKKTTDTPGWYATKENKRAILGDLRKALLSNEYTERSEACIDEMRHFVFKLSGQIVHMEAESDEDASGAGDNHGDRVTGTALMNKAFGILKADPAKQVDSKPFASFGSRRERRIAAMRKESEW